MKLKEIFIKRNILGWLGFLGLLIILIFMIYLKIKLGIFDIRFIIIYIAYIFFIFFSNLMSSGLENKLINRKLGENEKLMHLRMNHSLTFSIFSISISIGFIFEGLKENFQHWYIFVLGIILFIVGSVVLAKDYLARSTKLEKFYLKSKAKKIN